MPTEAVTKLYAGLDLHKSNVFCALIDEAGKPIYRRRLPTELPVILPALEPYRPHLQAVAVESTFNWYWLVDGLQAAGYPVRLANPAAMIAYSGIKQTDDESDALWLTAQTSDKKQPRCGQQTRLAGDVQPKKQQGRLGKPVGEPFVLIGTFNG